MHNGMNQNSLKDLEIKERVLIKKSKLQSAILAAVATAGILLVVSVAPNAFQILKVGNLEKKIKRYKLSALSRARKRLIDQGILCQVHTENGPALKLTLKGENIFQRIELNNVKIQRQKNWDKKWRIVIFDIREKKKGTRDELRLLLEKVGFLQIQDSVYLNPFPADKIVSMIKANYGVGRSMLYMIVDQIENDLHFKKHFQLSLER